MDSARRFPFHPRVEVAARGDRKLRLRDATAMAVGGMIGGGIFSVLGVTVGLAGHLAWVAFAIGGLIALMTAHSFGALSMRAGRSGGLFVFLADAGHRSLGAMLSWLLMFGYVIALAVYGFTFGHYAANVLGLPEVAADAGSVLVLAVFLLINLRGVGASAWSEDLVVAVKLLVLALIAGVGLAHFSPERLAPASDLTVAGVFVAASSIFVAYEGFELLSYDYDDIERPRRTLPRALYLSVGLVAVIYVVVTIGTQMLVSDDQIVAQREVAFATAGQAALGTAGYWIATLGALLASSSAINATLFSTARQMHEVASAGELPAVFARSRRGLPVSALVLLAVFGAAFAMLPDIGSLLAFGSAMFLMVFGVTNALAFLVLRGALSRAVSGIGALACTAALVTLVVQQLASSPSTVLLMAVCVLLVAALRWGFVRRRSHRSASDADDRERR
ncbi:amino acid permease [Agromyces tropicus]|uniref:Amino acid permease n=1 Tax=Agromyces tropicus TaxID=555371 RepID=A0ABP5FM26_9MICO